MITLTKHVDDGACFAAGRMWVTSANYFSSLSHLELTCSSISVLQEWLTGGRELEHLWKTTYYLRNNSSLFTAFRAAALNQNTFIQMKELL